MNKTIDKTIGSTDQSCGEDEDLVMTGSDSQIERARVNAFLEGLCSQSGDLKDVVILRHNIAGIIRRAVSDWDLASDSPEQLGEEIERELGEPWLTIKRDYVHQRYYPWGQIDILPKFVWHGQSYLAGTRYTERLETGLDGIQRPCLAHDAWITWMTGILWGGVYNERYVELMNTAFKNDEATLRRCAVRCFGRAWGEQLLVWMRSGMYDSICDNVNHLRRILFWSQLRNRGLQCIVSWVRHWFIELKYHIRPPFPWIAILGPDGSGKTSVLNGVRDAIKPSRIGIRLMHWRPNVFSKKENINEQVITNPQGAAPHGVLLSLLKLPMLAVDWWVGSLSAARHARAKHSIWVSDRYYRDLEVDPLRYRYGASKKFAGFMFRFFPQPAKVIILTGDADTIHARKEEVTLDELKRQLEEYRSLSQRMGEKAVEIDAGAPLEQVVEQAVNVIGEVCRKRSL